MTAIATMSAFDRLPPVLRDLLTREPLGLDPRAIEARLTRGVPVEKIARQIATIERRASR
ncbi:hypothetical protein C8J36_103541 [Rhizobium sp. PP-F2F-G48]|uniref:hypothetical protein n=1 Tax=Rhizobium sp. PP-F2F-G48 TaxID=2135651 RepID=UPI00104C8FCD|nr:hypothetical protein [Rhizobium sp. PP-F2F-G48]TCM56171.1 hypothetical protein C8J36_103541 [Rhizobium sp. PP-F2F-G48]